MAGSTIAGFHTPLSALTANSNADYDANTTVAAATTLGTVRFNGAAAGALSINGNLTADAVGLNNAGSFVFELGTSSDKVALDGTSALSIGAGVLGFNDFVFSNSGGLTKGTYTLFDSNVAIIGSLDAANSTGTFGSGFTGTLALADNGQDVVLNVVPEPSVYRSCCPERPRLPPEPAPPPLSSSVVSGL